MGKWVYFRCSFYYCLITSLIVLQKIKHLFVYTINCRFCVRNGTINHKTWLQQLFVFTAHKPIPPAITVRTSSLRCITLINGSSFRLRSCFLEDITFMTTLKGFPLGKHALTFYDFSLKSNLYGKGVNIMLTTIFLNSIYSSKHLKKI